MTISFNSEGNVTWGSTSFGATFTGGTITVDSTTGALSGTISVLEFGFQGSCTFLTGSQMNTAKTAITGSAVCSDEDVIISISLTKQGVQAFALTVARAGSGDGTVTGAGINCGSDCTEPYSSGTSVTLNATADPGSTLSEWTGCDSLVASCTLTMNANRTVVARFSKTIWTDDPIIPHATPVRAVHIIELCQAINTLRSRNGLGSFPCPSASTGATIQAAHITDLRTALDAVYVAKTGKPANYPTDPGTDPSALVGREIKAAHIRGIRNAVRGVE